MDKSIFYFIIFIDMYTSIGTTMQENVTLPKELFQDFVVTFQHLKDIAERIDHQITESELNDSTTTSSFISVQHFIDDLDDNQN
ncbi:hypothetical protein KBB05_00860 [Patescibacteria group bacterium]|nr:hypothetical protein [Patescibacteria group bacterium]